MIPTESQGSFPDLHRKEAKNGFLSTFQGVLAVKYMVLNTGIFVNFPHTYNTPQYTAMAKIPTVSLELRKKHKSDTDGYIKVVVYVPGTSRQKLKTTKYKVEEKYWNAEDQIVKRSHPEADDINREIGKDRDAIVSQYKDDLKKGVTFSADYIAQSLAPKKVGGDFLNFYQAHIDYLKVRVSADYCEHFQVEYNKLLNFAGEELSYSDITAAFLERYEVHIMSRKKPYAPTTINTKMKRLKEVIDKAIERGFIQQRDIAGYKWPNYDSPERDYLTLSQVESICNLLYNGEFDHDITYKSVIAFFLIECLSGIRFSDWGRFEVETLISGPALKVRAKKNGEPVYLPLNVFKRLGGVIDYIQANRLEMIVTNQEANRQLKRLFDKGFGKITTHMGRHTCGTLLGEMRYTDNEIAEVLGITAATARIYTKRTRQGLENTFKTKGGL